MLNPEYQWMIHKYQKPLVSFVNTDFNDDIFAHCGNKLRWVNIYI